MNRRVLIAFDFDGVIADSIKVMKDAFRKFLQVNQIEYTEKLFDRYNGVTFSAMISELKEKYNLDRNHDKLLADYQEVVNSITKNIEPIIGVENVLKSLNEQGYKMVISSSASREYLDTFIKKYGLEDFFQEVFTGESCAYTKPDSRYYSNVFSHYEGYEIFVVEDSDNGLIAAFNAGAKTIFFNDNGRKTVAPYHYSVNNLLQITGVIARQARRGYFIGNGDIDVVVKEINPSFSEEEKENIEKIWSNRPEHVFNGEVLAFDSLHYIDGKLIVECFVTEYKYVYSVRSKITPMAVSGICIDKNGKTIVSVRKRVTDYSGSYELIPSGGINKLCVENNKQGYKEQLLIELDEEGGADLAENVLGVDTLGICYDVVGNTMDICMKVRCRNDFTKLSFRNDNEEYGDKKLIEEVKEIKRLLKEKNVVITSKMILEHL